MKSLNNEQLLIDWLKTHIGEDLGSHQFQFNAINYMLNHGKYVTPDTVSRLWRKLREEYKTNRYSSTLHNANLKVKEVVKENSKQKHYRVEYVY